MQKKRRRPGIFRASSIVLAVSGLVVGGIGLMPAAEAAKTPGSPTPRHPAKPHVSHSSTAPHNPHRARSLPWTGTRSRWWQVGHAKLTRCGTPPSKA
jgi:hypothetical protein